jgi:protein-disulfide isomerase
MSINWTGTTIIARVSRMLAGRACLLLLYGISLVTSQAAQVPHRNDFLLLAAGDHSATGSGTFDGLGDPDAPVTIIAFISMTCCAQFWGATLPELNRRHIEVGKVRLVFLPADELSLVAFLLAGCSASDRYFQTIETLFARRREWVVAKPREPLLRITGLTEGAFDACLAAPQAPAYVEQSGAILAKIGKQAQVPTFIINGSILSGDVSITEMEQQFGR